MRKKYRTDKYAAALIISLMIFSLGFFLGNWVDDYKIEYVKDFMKQQETEFNSLQLQYMYLESINGKEKCPALYKTLEENIKMLGPTLNTILDYEKEKNVNSTVYMSLRRQYLIANLRYWLLSEDIRKTCESDTVTILYFFNTDCEVCFKSQGVILSDLKKAFEDKLLIYAIDSDFKYEPMVGLLNEKYNITKFPTLVINNNQKIEEFTNKSALLGIVCPKYANRQNITECRAYS